MPSPSHPYFLLIKQASPDANGVMLSAWRSAERLLTVGLWPLWQHTRNRKAITAGAKVAIYLAGTSEVVATASVASKEHWTAAHRRAYPLMLDGTPDSVLILDTVATFERAISVPGRIDKLSFLRPGAIKWGVAFMGGTRSLSKEDFDVLTKR